MKQLFPVKMVKERKKADSADISDDEYESLVKEVAGDNNNQGIRAIVIKSGTPQQPSSSSTIWKVLVVVLLGIIILLVTDAVEIKMLSGDSDSSKQSNPLLQVHFKGGSSITKNDSPGPDAATNDNDSTKESTKEDAATDAMNSDEGKEKGQEEGKAVAEEKPNGTPSSSSDGSKSDTPVNKEAPKNSDLTSGSSGSKGSASSQTGGTAEVGVQEPRYTYKPRGQPMPDDLKQKMVERWGTWTFSKTRPQSNIYSKYPNRDVPRAEFPTNAWQLDKEYLSGFLTQGKDLVMRTMEAILAEYGHGKNDSDQPFEERKAMFRLDMVDLETKAFHRKFPGNDIGGWTTEKSWAGLKRRLWHSVMTEDSFVFAMGGHSAAAGHG